MGPTTGCALCARQIKVLTAERDQARHALSEERKQLAHEVENHCAAVARLKKAREALGRLTEATGGQWSAFYYGADHPASCQCGASPAKHSYGALCAALEGR